MHLEGKLHIFMLKPHKTAKALCQLEPWNKECDCFSYDQSHVAYTEMKPTWVRSLASLVHHSMGKKPKELNRCPTNKERTIPLQQVPECLLMAAVHLLCPIMSKYDTPQTAFLGGKKKRWGSLLNIFNILLLKLTLQTPCFIC